MNQKSFSVSRLFSSIALTLTISACSSLGTQSHVDITAQPTLNSTAYAAQAKEMDPSSDRTDLLILELKAAVVEKDYQKAESLLDETLKLPLNDMQQAEWQMARAQITLDKEGSAAAIKRLNFQDHWQLADVQWNNYHQLRAKLFEDTKDYTNAARDLIATKEFQSANQREETDQRIWEDLNKYSKEQIVNQKAAPSEAELAGWLYVATEMKTASGSVTTLQSELQHWFSINASHPIVTNTPEDVQRLLDLNITIPQNVAILLPMNGRFEKPSELIRDGFFHAMTDDTNKDPNLKTTLYDTTTQSLEDIYAQLKANGTDFIVGPLVKDEVEKLESINNDSIPMLALNFPDELEDGVQVCYLSLSPEQEAEQAAKHIYESGYRFPLVLAPRGKLGERVTNAFKTEWTKVAHTSAASNTFGSRAQYSNDVQRAFNVAASQARISQISQITNAEVKSQARSRRDIDSVYIVASRSELSMIKPFIEVTVDPGVRQPKLFSSSTSNNGVARDYQDISGVAYSDIPLVINKDASASYDALWPNSSNGEKRLHALGMDAYHLLGQLPTMKVMQSYQYQGQTGLLSIDNQCAVQRELSWAVHAAPPALKDPNAVDEEGATDLDANPDEAPADVE